MAVTPTKPSWHPLPSRHFEGGANLAVPDEVDSLSKLLNDTVTYVEDVQEQLVVHAEDVQEQIVTIHDPILVPSIEIPPPIGSKGVLSYRIMTVGTSKLFVYFKVPNWYVSGGRFHVHWTKSQDSNKAGDKVKWEIAYRVADGVTEECSIADETLSDEDTYDDAGTTTRIVYQTADMPMTGLVAGKYVTATIQAVTPAASTLSAPGMVALDFLYEAQLNREVAAV